MVIGRSIERASERPVRKRHSTGMVENLRKWGSGSEKGSQGIENDRRRLFDFEKVKLSNLIEIYRDTDPPKVHVRRVLRIFLSSPRSAVFGSTAQEES